jgi:hypothetical protein
VAVCTKQKFPRCTSIIIRQLDAADLDGTDVDDVIDGIDFKNTR